MFLQNIGTNLTDYNLNSFNYHCIHTQDEKFSPVHHLQDHKHQTDVHKFITFYIFYFKTKDCGWAVISFAGKYSIFVLKLPVM